MKYPDMHALVVRYLLGLGHNVTGSIPADLSGPEPVVVVLDVAGSDDGLTDEALYDVQVFHPNRDVAWDTSETIRQQLRKLAGHDPSAGGNELVDTVDTVSRPTRRSYGNPDVNRYVATYRIRARLQ